MVPSQDTESGSKRRQPTDFWPDLGVSSLHWTHHRALQFSGGRSARHANGIAAGATAEQVVNQADESHSPT